MDLERLLPYAFYLLAAVTVILIAETVYLTAHGAIGRKRGLNRRLRSLSGGEAGEKVLIKLKAERGITAHGSAMVADSARLFLIQSGLRLTVGRTLALIGALTAALFSALLLLTTLGPATIAPIAAGIGVGMPLLVIRIARSRRQKKFSSQLPEALDIIVRSLRSGHPVPVAMAMVGRELSDPIGSEFGITLDEMTYGLDVEQAFRNLGGRIGHEDLALVITAISVQASTGGNLIDVLGNLSRILRERFQLRRKVKALSAEGRFSAYGLTALPILIFLAIYLQNPTYYQSVWHEPIFVPAMIALGVLMLIGDFIMYKLINFKF
jgi:tight adherence protein B